VNRYRVYWNIRRKCFSIQERVDGRWKVTAHAERLVLDVVSFTVSLKGQARVRRDGAKNVHAFMVADYLTQPGQAGFDDGQRDLKAVRYNPYRDDWFNVDGAPCVYADLVLCTVADGKPSLQAADPCTFDAVVDVTTVAA
jgi:hypothetical protein